jgi:hypothetical protein
MDFNTNTNKNNSNTESMAFRQHIIITNNYKMSDFTWVVQLSIDDDMQLRILWGTIPHILRVINTIVAACKNG